MAKHNELGHLGEELARNYLQEKNYKILESNWKAGRAEIDLIAMDKETLVFVEVKTRSNDFFGKPETGVSPKKQVLISKAAAAYMQKINHSWAIRFDVIAVLAKDITHPRINHLQDSFFPRLYKIR